MKLLNFLKTATLLSVTALLICGAVSCASHRAALGPDIYDRHADGEKLIADALAVAKRENKHVFAEFGANWCVWCHRLHSLLHSNEVVAPFFAKNYVMVMVDVDEVNDKTHNESLINRYGDPTTNGLPGVVVLDASGKVLTVQDSSAFAQGNQYEPGKALEFLKQHGPKPANN